MLRLVLTLSLLLAAVSVTVASDTPIPWRDRAETPDRFVQEQDPEVVSVDKISAFLADGSKPPERGFNDEEGPVYQVGLTEDEKAYLKKKPSEAFFRSVVLPGWGQRYGERNLRGAVFSGVEVALWTGLLLSRQEWVEGTDDYETFARQHAGVRGDPDHQYYVDIGNYNNLDEFNEAQREQRQYADQYRNRSSYWEWDTSNNREQFKDIRISADQAKNRIYYFAGGLVLNRILSSIDAARGLGSRQKNLRAKEASYSFSIGYNEFTRGPALTLNW